MNSKLSELEHIHKGIHCCTKCHGFKDGFIHYDPEKVQRKSFEHSLQSEIFIVAQSLAKDQVRLSGIPYHNPNLFLSNGGRYLNRYFNSVGYSLVPWDSTKNTFTLRI